MHQYRQESFALAILGIVLAGQAVMQWVAEVLHERLSIEQPPQNDQL